MSHRDPNFLAVKTANPPNPRISSSPHIPLVRAPQDHPQEPLVFSCRYIPRASSKQSIDLQEVIELSNTASLGDGINKCSKGLSLIIQCSAVWRNLLLREWQQAEHRH